MNQKAFGATFLYWVEFIGIEHQKRWFGFFFSVAPVATASYSKSFYESLNVPTMIVYGDKDVGLGLSSAKHLSDIPTATAPQILANSR